MRPELHPGVLQAVITLGLAGTSALLARTYRKSVYIWWTAAWWLYFARLIVIMAFVVTESRAYLFWHQVFTGWSALALLGTALAFAGSYRFKRWHLALAALPFAWAAIAIGRLDNVALAAIPAVIFLSAATLNTGWVFARFSRRTGSTGALYLAIAYALWGLHHLDYPILRARGAWVPWGYYLDIVFELAVGAGMLLLVVEDLGRGVAALSTISRELATSALRPRDAVLDALLERLLSLPAVRGAAFFERGATGPLAFARGAGVCRTWSGRPVHPDDTTLLERAVANGRGLLAPSWHGVDAAEASYTFAALLPVRPGSGPSGALVVVGDQRDPFAALDNRFLTALAEQVGAALEATAMASGLAQRTKELERLSALMLRQHEDERRRFARELHDESAQVLAAVKMELGMLRERLAPDDAVRLEDTIALLNGGIRGIRAVARDLRPALLDDLGLVPALRSLADDFRERSGLAVNVTLPDPERIPPLSRDAELAVFRALQEALANVARHASAETIDVRVNVTPEGLTLAVHDDGRGLGPAGGQHDGDDGVAHVGLAGMRERLAALGGTMTVADRREGGAALTIRLPASPPA